MCTTRKKDEGGGEVKGSFDGRAGVEYLKEDGAQAAFHQHRMEENSGTGAMSSGVTEAMAMPAARRLNARDMMTRGPSQLFLSLKIRLDSVVFTVPFLTR